MNNLGKNQTGQRQIAYNAVMLYIRMAVIMLVSLYISRIVLNELGEIDFGIYNIVGSVVVSLTFVQNTLVSSTQRFFSYEIGKGDYDELKRVFSMSINIHAVLIVIVCIFLETVGLYFLNYVLNIPDERMYAANVAYQFTIFTFAANLIRIPYNAIIFSFERMSAFAILSIFEAILKLVIAYWLIVTSQDKLIVYSILIFVITVLINSLYIYYCRKNYRNTIQYYYFKDVNLLKKMLGFSGWNFLGGVTSIATSEGPNYFMNIFIGVRINAAMGIAKQVTSAIYQFASNFQTAFNPQIVKSYAANEKEYLWSLVDNASKLSYYLLFLLALPIILNSDYIFTTWLGKVPEYSIQISVLLILSQFIAALSAPLWMLAHATGDIKRYQVLLSIINLTIIPVTWVLLYLKFSILWIFVYRIIIGMMVFAYRVIFLRNKVQFPCRRYILNIFKRSFCPSLLIIPIPFFLAFKLSGLLGLLLSGSISVLLTCVVFYYVAIDSNMRQAINKMALSQIRRS